jgi:hypothetical protein
VGDSDELCKLHYMNSCILLLQSLFSDIVSHYCQLSRKAITPLCPKSTQKFCCDLSLIKQKKEQVECMSSSHFFLYECHAIG